MNGLEPGPPETELDCSPPPAPLPFRETSTLLICRPFHLSLSPAFVCLLTFLSFSPKTKREGEQRLISPQDAARTIMGIDVPSLSHSLSLTHTHTHLCVLSFTRIDPPTHCLSRTHPHFAHCYLPETWAELKRRKSLFASSSFFDKSGVNWEEEEEGEIWRSLLQKTLVLMLTLLCQAMPWMCLERFASFTETD